MDEAAARWNASGATPLTLRTEEELLAFFDGMELVEPGLVSLPKWRPEPGTSFTDREVFQYGPVDCEIAATSATRPAAWARSPICTRMVEWKLSAVASVDSVPASRASRMKRVVSS
ncbi:SAM-dependent methyltransferase [Nonomuraea sp. NPDC050202]|uniref:SAM-dependent methyltransferase n=1 Tax=Nonomuraea sp. NPDC050202 TaxID=3155035 RepID=UPI0033F1C0AC